MLAALAGPPLAVHVKDARRGADAWRQVLLGEGEVPVAESVSALGAAGYRGWLVVEWEKHWHPELEEPEIALAQHAEAMAGVLGQDGKVELNR